MKNIITWKDFLNEEINSKKILMSGALVGGLMSSDPALSQNVTKNQVGDHVFYTNPQSAQVEFNGIRVGESLEITKKNLVEKGFTQKLTQGNLISWEGPIAGKSGRIYTISETVSNPDFPTTGPSQVIFVRKLVVIPETCASWDATKSALNKYVEILSKKYGAPSNQYFFFESPYEEGDGHEMLAIEKKSLVCNYYWYIPGGSILLKISPNFVPDPRDRAAIWIVYESNTNPALSQNSTKTQVEPIQSSVVKQEEYIEQNEWVFNHNFGFGEIAIRLKSDKNIKYQEPDLTKWPEIDRENILEKIKKELEKIGPSVYDKAKNSGNGEVKNEKYYYDQERSQFSRFFNGIKIYIQQKDSSSINIYKVEWWVLTEKVEYFQKYSIEEKQFVKVPKFEYRWIQIVINKSGNVWQKPVIPGTYQKECPILLPQEQPGK